MTTNSTLTPKTQLRCAIYTRKSSEEGLEQEFNSLDAQRLAGENYIASQQHEGWVLVPQHYDDGGYSGGNLERPGLKRLFQDIRDNQIDCIVVYKIDRLTRSLLDFTRIIALFDEYNVSFVSVTQSFNTSNSMGRLMLNVLLSFAQYERELTGERIRDKVDASKKQGMWMGGTIPLGYDVNDRKLVINEAEAKIIRLLYQQFLETQSLISVVRDINALGLRTKHWISNAGIVHSGRAFEKKNVRRILQNPMYRGKVRHKGQDYNGQHEAIIDEKTWQQVQACFSQRERPPGIGARRTTVPLLKGLIRCGECDTCMIPTYTHKQGKQYRYYLCEHQHRGMQDNCAIGRIAAGVIETVVIKQVTRLLKQPEVAVKTIAAANDGLPENDIIRALQSIECVWAELFPAEQARIVNLLLESVVVMTTGIAINIYTAGLSTLTRELEIA